MKAHVIENGVVINTIEVDSLDFMPNLVEATEGGIGWVYADGVFTNPNEPTQEELDARQAKSVRTQRDAKLAETDFYALSDVTMSAEMTTYRQALRDITAHADFPYLDDDDWPTKP